MADKRFESLRNLGILSSLGIMFALSIFIGLAVGIQFDKWFKTSPWFTFLFLILGIISAFLSLYREIKKLVTQEDEENVEETIDQFKAD